MRKALYLIALGCTAFVGCHAEVRTKADFSASARGNAEDLDDSEDTATSWDSEPAAQAKASQDPSPVPTRASFIGVTPDLTLAPSSSRTPACMCLALEHGAPGKSAFQWQGGTPEATTETMAVAISGEGVPCAWNAEGAVPPIPSIAAVERSGQDVVLTIEPAREGRPIMRGAVILRPGAKGELIVKGRGRVPFGRPADGSAGTCRIPVK